MTARVVHVASGREWRGGQRQVWLLARELARAGVEQVVVTGAGTELATRLAAAAVAVRALPWRAGLDPRVLPGLFAELRGARAIVHAHDAHAVALGGLAARLMGRPFVATRRVEFPLRRPHAWARADRIIAISEAVAGALAASGIGRDRIAIVPSGIPIEEVRALPRLGVRQDLGLPPDALVAASVGALTAEKDHVTLLHAAARLAERLPSLHWVVAGEGPERRVLERLSARLGLDGCVHLLGRIDEPARLVADASVFVSSSRHEGLGTSLLEAMALGIPIAAAAAGGPREVLRDGAGVLIAPGDPDALAAAVARLLLEPELASGVVGRASMAVERFTVARMAEGVRSVYRSCAPFP